MLAITRWLPPLVLAGALVVGFWAFIGRGIDLPPAPSPKLACLSYTPFQGDQTPYDRALVIPPAQIAADLDRLRPVTDCVRIYATDQGIDATVPLAAARGMQVLLGIWIGSEPALYEPQIARAIELAREYPRTVKAIIVGNEVLLRGEQSGERLADLVHRVKAASGLPVTYADVWGFWQKAPNALVDAVDFMTIHLLPYWEDDPRPADEAIRHLDHVLDTMTAQFPGKALMVGETGWPSAGRAREDAVPSLVEQARYLRLFMRDVAARGIDYNIIEAFDQPWKRHQEGAVGGYWGVFDTDREAKFDWFGPVSNHPGWPRLAVLSIGIGLAALGLARIVASAPVHPWASAGIALAGGCLMVLQGERAMLIAVGPGDVAMELVLLAQSWLVLVLCLRGDPGLGEASIARALAWLQAPRGVPPLSALARAFVLVGAATVALALAFDGRYRGFPLATYALPALLFLLSQWRHGTFLTPRPDAREELFLAMIFIGTALYIPLAEGLNNLQALFWSAILMAFALNLAGAFRPQRRISASTESRNPAPAGPAL
ncbi:MAG: hypothetical protein JNL25_17835 [Rhodospirillaceae bacterium]|nr:hypothetical protein [Rhodospirillaceae bacterium]